MQYTYLYYLLIYLDIYTYLGDYFNSIQFIIYLIWWFPCTYNVRGAKHIAVYGFIRPFSPYVIRMYVQCIDQYTMDHRSMNTSDGGFYSADLDLDNN